MGDPRIEKGHPISVPDGAAPKYLGGRSKGDSWTFANM